MMTLSTPFKFATRLSIATALSCLFLFWESSASSSSSSSAFAFPEQSVWVFVTVVLVSWFPSMDSASVMRKTVERILGTIIGACLGLGIVFLWATMTTTLSPNGRFVVFVVMISIVVFLYSFAILKFSWIEHQFSYAAVIGLVTLGITTFPFVEENEQWWMGPLRTVNVIFGCLLGGMVSLVVWPHSTHYQLAQKVQNQVRLAGEASEAVLMAASRVLGQRPTAGNSPEIYSADAELKPLPQILLQEEDEDLVHQKYAQALTEWNAAKALFPMLPYDPFRYFCARTWSSEAVSNLNNLDDDQETQSFPAHSGTKRQSMTTKMFQDQAAMALARAFRLQTTVVLLDSFLRNYSSSSGTQHSCYCSFPEEELRLFARVAQLLGRLLAGESAKDSKDDSAGKRSGKETANLFPDPSNKSEEQPLESQPRNATAQTNGSHFDEELALEEEEEERFADDYSVSRTTKSASATAPRESNNRGNGDEIEQQRTFRGRTPALKRISILSVTTHTASSSNDASATNMAVSATLRTSNVDICNKAVTQCLLKELRAVRKLIVDEAAVVVAAAAASAAPLSGSAFSQDKENELLIRDLQKQQWDQGVPAVFLGFSVHSTDCDEASSSHASSASSSLSSSRLLFLQLVEHLILRGLRLYYSTIAHKDENHSNHSDK